ncbi:peptidylprolyl isomerase fpr4 [Geranomyces variabilis]|uniref:FK506-binding protein n=1 Tax=Geranomyces variabilis TaxID=109894 RepID=A0AAD5TK94_9FUNG|nr:peptidylprolyl isomerase fpr4 [Geranomyces variabilis]
MSFLKAGIWGLKVQSGKEYSTQVQDSFTITMAALTANLPKNGARTSISIQKDDREFVICSLTPGKIEQQVLDLTFLEGEEITFKTTGPCDVDLTGNSLVFTGDDEEDDEEYDSEDSEEGRFMEFGSGDDEDDEDESSADEEELQAQMQAAIAAMNGKRKAGAALPASAKKAKITEVVEEEVKQEAPKPAIAPVTPAQTKKQAAAAKKAEAAAAASVKKDVKKDAEPATPAAAKKADTPLSAKAVAKAAAPASPAASTPAKSTPATTPKSTKKTLANGLIIEDVTEGNGPKAKNGKKVGVRYIGRLTNGKVFDSNTKGAPFKFKLGAGDVIKGWDLGVAGMSVGGTRKLTIPAALAYGPKGAPPDIPGHATLEFEVKLMEVK